MRGFSKLVNEKLEKVEGIELKTAKTKDVEKRKMSIIEKTFGAWGPGPSGAEYVRKLRKESEIEVEEPY